MTDNRIRLPSSGGGLMSFSDSAGAKIQIKPSHVIIMLLVVIAIEIMLHAFGYAWFGIPK